MRRFLYLNSPFSRRVRDSALAAGYRFTLRDDHAFYGFPLIHLDTIFARWVHLLDDDRFRSGRPLESDAQQLAVAAPQRLNPLFQHDLLGAEESAEPLGEKPGGELGRDERAMGRRAPRLAWGRRITHDAARSS